MNSIFFLIVSIIPVLFIGLIPLASAEIGINFDRELIQTFPDGTKQYSFTTAPERMLENNNYVDYIFTDGINNLQVETKHGSISLDKVSCGFSYFKSGLINGSPLFTDSIIPRMANDGTDNWNIINQINDAACVASWDGVQLVATKSVDGIGLLQYKYINTGSSWKTQLEATNYSSLTDKKFGFTQTINLNRDSIKFGGIQRNLDNFNNTTFDRLFLENNEAKVLNLLNGVNFDFDLGFDNLWSISVYDTGVNSSKLAFDYTRNSIVILPGETIVIDPTYNAATATDGRLLGGSAAGASCPSYNSNDGATYAVIKDSSYAGANGCQIMYAQYDLSSLGSSWTVDSGYIEYDVTIIAGVAKDGIFRISSTNTIGSQMYDDGAYIGGDAGVNATAPTEFGVVADGYTANIISSAFSTLESKFGGTITILGTQANTARDGADHTTEIRGNDMILNIVYTTIPNPDAVDDLVSTTIAPTTVNLAWTQPNLQTGNLSGYMINYTTPWDNVANTIITNDTGNSDVTTQVTGLTELTPYSFRIGVWTEGFNGSGNILNITTIEDFTLANFTPGFFDLNATNDDIIQIFFERQDINSTALFLNVTYPNTYALACDFSYQFANINQTYNNLSNVTISSNAVESSFQFNDVDNEIIDVYCWNELNVNNDGSYIITQTNFPLLTQIDNFRNGTYGTQGDFGAMDFITLAVVIISMIGFNRVNESVGAIFNIILLGSLAFFEIIELPTIIFGAIAVVIMLVITTTRKT